MLPKIYDLLYSYLIKSKSPYVVLPVAVGGSFHIRSTYNEGRRLTHIQQRTFFFFFFKIYRYFIHKPDYIFDYLIISVPPLQLVQSALL